MDLLNQQLSDYIDSHTSPESKVLEALNRETNAKVLMPRMLSGHLQGRVLSMLSKMIQPRRILEIGTYTGYSALCLAEGLIDNGFLHTIDINDELNSMVKKYIHTANMDEKIITHIGNALDIIPQLNEVFDIVFIDADKVNYSRYFDMIMDKVRKGGFIIADNVLWSGKITLPENEADKDTRALQIFNDKVHNDPRVEHVLFPVRDGLMVMRKL
ncbi:MAG TPA: O-methyltransferase [Bacteroidia bacterium]|nr:O-methyltransferase [Bacteroidia bacterium]